MAEAVLVRAADDARLTAAASITAAEVHQMADGRAGYLTGSAVTSGDRAAFRTSGIVTMPKTASVVLLDGGRAYWDHSANTVTYKKVNDRDFYAGRIVGDAASADTTCAVNLNIDPPYDIDLVRDGFLSVPTGTQAAGGFGHPKVFGGSRGLELTATSEAQCIDLLSVDRFDKGSNAIIEIVFRPIANGSTSDVDFNCGIGNGTSTTDADAVTEHVLFHIDGGATTILAQSKDTVTTNAAASGSVSITAGSAVANRTEVWIDTRNPADCQLYVNAALILGSTTFTLNAATGPLGILAHLEKTTGTATGNFVIDRAVARYAQQ